MKRYEDLNPEEKAKYDAIKGELDALEPLLDSWEFKNKIETKKEVIGKYLELSKKQSEILPHSRKRRFKDKAIKEVYDYSLSALELKAKSRAGFERMRNNFNKLFESKMSKAKNKK